MATRGGDGRDVASPLFIVPVVETETTNSKTGVTTYSYEANSATSPSFVRLSDGTNAVALLPDGTGGYGLPSVDTPVRRLLEKILLVQEDIRAELTKLNGGR